jgi:hypothetical protein
MSTITTSNTESPPPWPYHPYNHHNNHLILVVRHRGVAVGGVGVCRGEGRLGERHFIPAAVLTHVRERGVQIRRQLTVLGRLDA